MYIHACTNETHSLANLQYLISTLAIIIISSTNQPKVRIKFCRFARECVSFVQAWMYVTKILLLCKLKTWSCLHLVANDDHRQSETNQATELSLGDNLVITQ